MITLTEIRQILRQENLQLTQSLGQNFMHDQNQVRRLISAAALKPGDSVLEIGPGLGPLTEVLLEYGVQVLAIEKDRRLIEVLRRRIPGCTRLTVLHADALDYLAGSDQDWSSWKLVSNMPYSVASPILVELALNPAPPQRIVTTVQWEVAQRMQAGPGDKLYGILSLLIQVRYRAIGCFKIPQGCFFPPPDVESAGIILERCDPARLAGDAFARFSQIVKISFSQRRKMMLKLLKSVWPPTLVERGFHLARIPLTARAETVALDQFLILTQVLGVKDELFDVVDANDEVIAQKPRSEVHRLGLNHRAVHMLLFNRAGCVFLQKRSQQKDRCAGLWDSSASGHLDAGESYDAAAVRELHEELGYTPAKPLVKLLKLDACPETDHEFTCVYHGTSEGPFNLNQDEIERGEWIAPADLDQWIRRQPEAFAGSFLHIWRILQQQHVLSHGDQSVKLD
jgi:16S rRNA (adenine1518-N6/adenine1519-N6)-dimethyltransferase